MIFNSYEFALFFSTVFLLYWTVFSKTAQLRNGFLVAVSYFFYAWFDWRFMGLLALVTSTTYLTGLKLGRETNDKSRYRWLLLCMTVLLGSLGIFKYYDFFAENFNSLFAAAGLGAHLPLLKVILPVGISFYTFMALGYLLDVYWKKMEPEKDVLAYFAFAGFFPQLTAGPVERASNMLPQYAHAPQFSYDLAVDGMRQLLWGLFKKVVVADNIALYANDIFVNYQTLSGSELLLGAAYYSFQLYFDFSGYTDMALGIGKLLGIRLMPNFNYPYFSQNITEFWRRWHISLSTWFRDYLFNPLAITFRDYGQNGVMAAMLLCFLLIGFWHEATWTLVVFGLLHGLILTYELLTKKFRKRLKKQTPPLAYQWGSILLTFFVWCLTQVFFRSPTLPDAFRYIGRMFSVSPLPDNFRFFNQLPLGLILGMMLLEWFCQKEEYPLRALRFPTPVRWALYLFMGFCVLNFMHYKQAFIYFKF
jgi:D-alanyl-lipoteichoic acid acyltransferase DltB (MBOAT superfamily)